MKPPSILKPRPLAVAGVLVLAFACVRMSSSTTPADIVPPDEVAAITMPSATVAHDVVPDKSAETLRDEATYKLPKSIDLDKYTVLRDWVFPIVNANEQMPWNPQRHFGALRGEIHRSDCMRGHCGVDLDGP